MSKYRYKRISWVSLAHRLRNQSKPNLPDPLLHPPPATALQIPQPWPLGPRIGNAHIDYDPFFPYLADNYGSCVDRDLNWTTHRENAPMHNLIFFFLFTPHQTFPDPPCSNLSSPSIIFHFLFAGMSTMLACNMYYPMWFERIREGFVLMRGACDSRTEDKFKSLSQCGPQTFLKE